MKNIKKLKSALSLFLAVTLVFAIAAPLCLSASARGSVFPQIRDCYYYTDSDAGGDVYDLLVEDNFFEYRSLYGGFESVIEGIESCYASGKYFSEENALVVFDLTKGFPQQMANEKTPLLSNLLLQVFSKLKENGCKIIFICATDEVRLGTYNEFLEYVDIHINTDLFFLFISNVFYRAFEENGYDMTLRDCTFILDSSMSGNPDANLKEWSSYFQYYIRPFFCEAYKSELSQSGDEKDALANHNVQILCHVEGEQYYNYTNGTMVSNPSPEFRECLQNTHVYAIGTADLEKEVELNDWLNSIVNMDYDFPIFVFGRLDNIGGFYEINNLYFLKNSCDLTQVMSHALMMKNTDLDVDLTSFDNWEGKCVITHKPIEFSEDGWIKNVFCLPEEEGAERFAPECWNVIIEE